MNEDEYHCTIDESAGLADAIEITTFDSDGQEIDHAFADGPAAASLAARTLLEDAEEAGHELRDVTVRLRKNGQELVFGRDVTIEGLAA